MLLGGAVAARNVRCDIVVAGGSTASLAAAITAAEAEPTLTVCFTELTDWPGGQMTAGGVPAIDFGYGSPGRPGGFNALAENQPASFRSAMASIPGTGAPPGPWPRLDVNGSGSPGACQVSRKCYLPNVLIEDWITRQLAVSPNLKTFLRTAITGTTRDPASGAVVSLHAVQRTPTAAGLPEWSARLSSELRDWYETLDSAAYLKESLVLHGRIFIEATELGDVLATSGLDFLQGAETPFENSTAVISTCGQAATLTFYAELLARNATPPPAPVPPAGGDEGFPWTANLSRSEFEYTWSWRRAYDPSPTRRQLDDVNVGDVTQQNLGNDLDSAYLFPPLEAVRAEAAAGWRGGVNLTALYMLEQRSYGWLGLLQSSAAALEPDEWAGRLVLNRTTSGTQHGLSKMVYLRDSRRAVGVDGFKLLHSQLRDTPGQTGEKFADAVALGEYNDDTHMLRNSSTVTVNCSYPAYLNGKSEGAKPYYIPMRALMVGGAPNLLVAGKLMAQSFHANSNTRVHPSEWSSGVAAGGTAALMLMRGWHDTSDAYANVAVVRSYLNSSKVGQPLDWTGLPPP
jgi:hypothetical protein